MMNEQIQLFMSKLDLTKEEALELYLFDNGKIENEEEKALTEKASKTIKNYTKSSVQPKKSDSIAKIKTQKAKRKTDSIKKGVIDTVQASLLEVDYLQNTQIVKEEGQISFKDLDGNYYSLKLTKHKGKPDGFREV